MMDDGTGVPEQVLTDEYKVFTGRLARRPATVAFDRLCRHDGIRHILTAPSSPTTTGKIERLHKTIRKELPSERTFTSRHALQLCVADPCRTASLNWPPLEPRSDDLKWPHPANGGSTKLRSSLRCVLELESPDGVLRTTRPVRSGRNGKVERSHRIDQEELGRTLEWVVIHDT